MNDRATLAERLLRAGARLDGGRAEALEADIRRTADRLAAAGVRGGDLVLLAGLAPTAMLIHVLACWLLDAGAWLSTRPAAEIPPGRASFRIAADTAIEPDSRTTPEPAAVVHETSGSTGEPKLARRSASSIHAEIDGYRKGLALTEDAIVRIPVPIAHSFGSGVAISALFAGCAVDTRPLGSTTRIAVDLDQGAITHLAATPPVARLVVDTSRRGEHHPGAILVGTGGVSDDLDAACAARFGVPITRGYGSSETGGIFIGPRGIGEPITAVEILTPAVGERGVLTVAMTAPVLGYVDEEPRTSRLWRTCDIVERDVTGQVCFVEREPGRLRVNGRFVDVSRLRARILADAANSGVTLRDLVVLSQPRRNRPEFEDLVVVVEAPGVSRELIEDIARACTERDLVPRVHTCDELPRTPMGKLDRKGLTKWLATDA